MIAPRTTRLLSRLVAPVVALMTIGTVSLMALGQLTVRSHLEQSARPLGEAAMTEISRTLDSQASREPVSPVTIAGSA